MPKFNTTIKLVTPLPFRKPTLHRGKQLVFLMPSQQVQLYQGDLHRGSTVTMPAKKAWREIPVCGPDDEHILLGTHAVHLSQQLVDDTVSSTACCRTVHVDLSNHPFNQGAYFHSITIKQFLNICPLRCFKIFCGGEDLLRASRMERTSF